MVWLKGICRTGQLVACAHELVSGKRVLGHCDMCRKSGQVASYTSKIDAPNGELENPLQEILGLTYPISGQKLKYMAEH